MSSHLTRQVFRCLLANEPIAHHGCLRQQARPSTSSLSYTGRNGPLIRQFQVIRLSQTRTMFNFFGKRKVVKEADMDPGVEKMMDLVRLQRMRARLPPPGEVAVALKQLFVAKRRRYTNLEDNQAQLALQSLKYCSDMASKLESEDEIPSKLVSPDTLYEAAHVLRRNYHTSTKAHVELAQAISVAASRTGDALLKLNCSLAHLNTLCATGSSDQGRNQLLELEQKAAAADLAANDLSNEDNEPLEQSIQNSEAKSASHLTNAWLAVLRGFALECNELELQHTLQMIKDRGLHQDKLWQIARQMLSFYVRNGDKTTIRQWWSEYCRHIDMVVVDKPKVTALAKDIHGLLMWCVGNDQLELGHEVVRHVMRNNPPKVLWDVIFVWAASTGKGVDEINRMINVMEEANDKVTDRSKLKAADAATINALVEFAATKKDPYTAERFITMGKERNIQPDRKTYILQMEYRLMVNDIDGALIAYNKLQVMDRVSDDDLIAVNRLIVALCSTKRHDFDSIMNVAADLSDRRARFEADTVTSLALLHLGRGERADVVDLLNTHAFHYSTHDRERIRNAIVEFALDPKTTTTLSWDAYTVVRETFDETPRSKRTDMMSSFFDRKRPDMACHVFLNMRHHSREDIIPDISTYVAALTGAAKIKDAESTGVIHNQLKLDFNINVNTHLLNSLIIAFTACEQPRRALGFWDEIVGSREGPTFNSIHAALRACEKAPFGDLKAQEIWSMLRRRGVKLDQALWTSYIAALAGNGDTNLAIETLESALEKGEIEVSSFMLGSLYMSAPSLTKQGEVEVWAQQKFPGLWSELEKIEPEEEDFSPQTMMKMDRSLSP